MLKTFEESNKYLMDKAFLALFILLLTINVFFQTVQNIFGGVGNFLVIYLLCFYFMFFYGEHNYRKIGTLSVVVFLICYILINQFLWETKLTYETFGIKFKTTVWNLVMLVPFVFIALRIYQRSDKFRLEWCKKVLILCLVILIIATLIILRINPNASKGNATGNQTTFYPFLMGYAVVYAISIMLPCFFSWVIKAKSFKVFKWLFFVALIIVVIQTSYFIAIISIALGLISFAFLSIKDKFAKWFLLTISLLLVVYIFMSGFIEDWMLELAGDVSNNNIKERLKETANYFKYGSTDNTAARFELYSNVILDWLKHPFLGNIIYDADIVLSGHSTNFDILAGCGAIVFVAYIIFIINIYKANIRCCSGNNSAITASLISFLFVSTFNPIMASSAIYVFFILIPILFCFEEK